MDVEKARALLRDVLKLVGTTRSPSADAQGYWTRDKDCIALDVEAALRALDGDGAGEWEARTDTGDLYRMDGWPIIASGHAIAVCVRADTARRIARLPALERAAREVIAAASHAHKLDVYVQLQHGTVNALRAAIKQES